MKTRSIRIERVGAPEVLVERTVELAEPGPGEALIEVEAAGVNFADLLMRAGLYATVPQKPFAPGFEVAGRIVRAGSEVRTLGEGDRVLALLRFGGYARHVLAPAGHLFALEGGLTQVQAAAIPVNFLTAWVCLFESARARQTETVLVLGAAGGVGTAAVQLAVSKGLRVIGTAGTPRKRAFVTRELGAAACFDSSADWEAEVRLAVADRGLDVALDAVGGAATAACVRLLAPTGRLVVYGLSSAMPGERRNWLRAASAYLRTPRFHPYALIGKNIGVHGVHLLHLAGRERVLQAAMSDLFPAFAEGTLRPILDEVYPLDRDGAVAAHDRLHGRKNLGKVVLATDAARAEHDRITRGAG